MDVSRVRINLDILNCEKKWPEEPLKAFRDAIITYHYLSRNPKFTMETDN